MIKYERYLVKEDLKKILNKADLKREIPAALEPESDLDEETITRKAEEKEAEQEKKREKKAKAEDDVDNDNNDNVDSSTPSSPVRRTTNDSKAPPSRERLEKRLDQLSQRLAAAKLQMLDRDENKTTSLATSKTNYIDPRITTAWCQKHGVPIEKMFNKTLREKFKWAMLVPEGWQF